MAETHATLSPSSADRWMTCPGSVPLSEGIVDTSSEYAAEGSAAHEIAALCLTNSSDAAAYVGRIVEIDTREIGPGQVEARKVGSGEVHRPPAAARRLGHVHGAIRQPGKHAGRCGGLTSLRPRRLLRFTGGQHLLGGGLHRSHLIEQLELPGRG